MFSVLFSGEDVWGAGSGPCGVTHLLSSPPCGERTRRAGGAEAGGHRLGGVPQPPRERKRALPRGLAGALEEEAQVGLLTLARCGPVLRLVLGRPEGEGGGGGQGQHRCSGVWGCKPRTLEVPDLRPEDMPRPPPGQPAGGTGGDGLCHLDRPGTLTKAPSPHSHAAHTLGLY